MSTSAHELIFDEAPWVWIVHDLERYIGEYVLHCHILDHEDQGMMQDVQINNPRAMSAKVKGFRPAQSRFQDFTSVYMG
jgi:hypothetical protein